MRSNLFMIFHYDGQAEPARFGYIITQKAFDTFIGSNQPNGTRLVEEDVDFPYQFMSGDTRLAIVHYVPDGSKFAAYVPVFPTEAETEEYSKAFRKDQ